ncbi:RDD family protein [Pararhodobacter zhoushanensis]|uniref:RDD family protein n=1 Tax=Pararhodobacter zhoushanensis TaxID=2479545 RepID=UPI000F8C3408|nr:RDD family protein [Pararhodobacter zhoushanensis]
MRLPDPVENPDFYDHLVAKRLLAWVIDLIVTLGLMLVVLIGTAFLAIFIFPLVWSAIAIAYRTVMLTRYGATLGMMVASVQLRQLNGRTPSREIALTHSILYALSMVFVLPQIGSVAMMMLTPYRQGLNDWILGTTIINKYMED